MVCFHQEEGTSTGYSCAGLKPTWRISYDFRQVCRGDCSQETRGGITFTRPAYRYQELEAESLSEQQRLLNSRGRDISAPSKSKTQLSQTECKLSSIYRAISKKIPELTGLARYRLGTSSCWVAGLCSLSLILCGAQLGKRVHTLAPWQVTFLAGGGNHESIAYRAPVLSWEARRG